MSTGFLADVWQMDKKVANRWPAGFTSRWEEDGLCRVPMYVERVLVERVLVGRLLVEMIEEKQRPKMMTML